MICEYDDVQLPERDGVPDACPTCEYDIQDHAEGCRWCTGMVNLPEPGGIDLDTLRRAE